MIQLGMEVNHKIHSDLNGSEVIMLDRVTNIAVIKNWLSDFEFQTVDVFLSDLEIAWISKMVSYDTWLWYHNDYNRNINQSKNHDPIRYGSQSQNPQRSQWKWGHNVG